MGKRSTSRRLAMQIIYQKEVSNDPLEKVKENVFDSGEFIGLTQNFAASLAEGVFAHLDEIDASISALSENWDIKRLSLVDKSILRLAVFELKFSKDSPPKVVINEAVELAKKFGGEDSPGFVNGILGAAFKG